MTLNHQMVLLLLENPLLPTKTLTCSTQIWEFFFIKILAFWSLISVGVSLMDTNSHLVVGHTSCIDGLEWVFSSSLNTGIRTYYWKEDASLLFPSASIALSWEQITCASLYCILCLEADMIVYPEKMCLLKTL